jgi:hypothetical protein
VYFLPKCGGDSRGSWETMTRRTRRDGTTHPGFRAKAAIAAIEGGKTLSEWRQCLMCEPIAYRYELPFMPRLSNSGPPERLPEVGQEPQACGRRGHRHFGQRLRGDGPWWKRQLRPARCMDDISVQNPGIREAIETRGAILWDLPPYSPISIGVETTMRSDRTAQLATKCLQCFIERRATPTSSPPD